MIGFQIGIPAMGFFLRALYLPLFSGGKRMR
jgi:hypothetical protein